MRKPDFKNSNGHGSGRVKFRYADADRYIDFDMDNANTQVAEGIKSLANALSGRNVVMPIRVLTPSKATAAAAPAIDQTELEFPIAEDDQAEPEITEEIAADEPSTGNGNGPKRTYNFKAPTFLDDLDLNKASTPLAEFIGAKNPSDTIDKYLVVAFWLQKYMNVPEVTVDHIYTVFDHLGWKGEMPVKPGKPLADLKSKRHMLTREEGAAGYKVNFKGEQHVENMGADK
jgi:hypothetical protein